MFIHPSHAYAGNRAAFDPAAGGGGLDAATTAWVNQVVANGGTVSSTSQGYVDTLIKAIKADVNLGPNINSVFDRILLLANFDSNGPQALTSLANPTSSIAVANGAFTSTTLGYQSNGTTGVIDSAFNPATQGTNYTLNSATVGVYGLTNRVASQAWIEIGCQDVATNAIQLLPEFSSNASYINSSSQVMGTPGFNANGFQAISRTGSGSTGTTTYSVNGSGTNSITSAANASTSIPSFNIFICGRNNAGAADSFSGDKLALAFVSGGLTTTQLASLAGYINTYMTSLGINVY